MASKIYWYIKMGYLKKSAPKLAVKVKVEPSPRVSMAGCSRILDLWKSDHRLHDIAPQCLGKPIPKQDTETGGWYRLETKEETGSVRASSILNPLHKTESSEDNCSIMYCTQRPPEGLQLLDEEGSETWRWCRNTFLSAPCLAFSASLLWAALFGPQSKVLI